MPGSTTNVAVLGSTGSIGRSTLEVIAASGGALRVAALSAHRNLDLLVEQAKQYRPQLVIATNAEAAGAFDWSALPPGTELRVGEQGIDEAVRSPGVDVVVAAIVGGAGLMGAWSAIDAGKKLALANKESLVMAGPLVMELARRKNVSIAPIDSEHSAVFQALHCGRREEVRRVVLTASGGPFLRHSADELAHVTVEQALAHPTWDMGRKITIDSATMMNKALEIIEARWLFDLRPDQIEVVIHPQSIVHSLVEFCDGSVIAQMSPPDMRLAIQYALTYPARTDGVAKKMDWSRSMLLEFEPPDRDRFPAIELGLEVATVGGTAGAVLNAANEAAVTAFLSGELGFAEIVSATRAVLEHHTFDAQPTLQRLLELDRWAREEVNRWICT